MLLSQSYTVYTKASLGPIWDHLKLLYIERLTASSFLFFFTPLCSTVMVVSNTNDCCSLRLSDLHIHQSVLHHRINAANTVFLDRVQCWVLMSDSASTSVHCPGQRLVHVYIALAVSCRQSRAVSHCQQMLRMATAGLDSYCPACLLPCAAPVAAPAAPLHHPSRSNYPHSWDSQQQAAEQPVYVQRHSSNAEGDKPAASEGSKSGKARQAGGSNRDVVVGGSGRDVTAGRSDEREVIATQQQASDAQQHLLPSSATAEAGHISKASSEQLLAWVSNSPCNEVVCRQYTAVTLLHAHASAFCSCWATYVCAC